MEQNVVAASRGASPCDMATGGHSGRILGSLDPHPDLNLLHIVHAQAKLGVLQQVFSMRFGCSSACPLSSGVLFSDSLSSCPAIFLSLRTRAHFLEQSSQSPR